LDFSIQLKADTNHLARAHNSNNCFSYSNRHSTCNRKFNLNRVSRRFSKSKTITSFCNSSKTNCMSIRLNPQKPA
jgi:hypothetical protein